MSYDGGDNIKNAWRHKDCMEIPRRRYPGSFKQVSGKGISPVIKYINSSKRQIFVQIPALICSGLELDQVTSPRLICLVYKMKLAMGPTLLEVLHSMPGSGQVLANFAHHLLIWNMHILWIKTLFWIAMLANFVIREEEEWKETFPSPRKTSLTWLCKIIPKHNRTWKWLLSHESMTIQGRSQK